MHANARAPQSNRTLHLRPASRAECAQNPRVFFFARGRGVPAQLRLQLQPRLPRRSLRRGCAHFTCALRSAPNALRNRTRNKNLMHTIQKQKRNKNHVEGGVAVQHSGHLSYVCCGGTRFLLWSVAAWCGRCRAGTIRPPGIEPRLLRTPPAPCQTKKLGFRAHSAQDAAANQPCNHTAPHHTAPHHTTKREPKRSTTINSKSIERCWSPKQPSASTKGWHVQYTQPGSSWRTSARWADVIATRP